MLSEKPKLGYQIIGTIKNVKGTCSAGHKEGDQIELSGYGSYPQLCGFFYHDIFPYVIMLQFGGGFPSDWGGDPEVVELTCIDKVNAVTIELKRIKED